MKNPNIKYVSGANFDEMIGKHVIYISENLLENINSEIEKTLRVFVLLIHESAYYSLR